MSLPYSALFVLLWTSVDCDRLCTNTENNACKCSDDSGQLWDLTPLSSEEGESAFTTKEGYAYNPCKSFKCTKRSSHVTKVSLCDHTNNLTKVIGYQDFAQFFIPEESGKPPYIMYEGNFGAKNKVILKCADESLKQKDFVCEDCIAKNKIFKLSTKFACATKKSSAQIKKTSKLSIGSMILIVALVIFLIGYIGTIGYRYNVQNLRGLDVFPRLTLLLTFFYLNYLGAKYIVHKCTTKKENDYEKLLFEFES